MIEKVRFYINGEYKGMKTSTQASLPDFDGMHEIQLGNNGHDSGTGHCGQCHINDLQIYNNVLTDQQVAEIYTR